MGGRHLFQAPSRLVPSGSHWDLDFSDSFFSFSLVLLAGSNHLDRSRDSDYSFFHRTYVSERISSLAGAWIHRLEYICRRKAFNRTVNVFYLPKDHWNRQTNAQNIHIHENPEASFGKRIVNSCRRMSISRSSRLLTSGLPSFSLKYKGSQMNNATLDN